MRRRRTTTRRELLAKPADTDFYLGLPDAPLRGGLGVYFVASAEMTVRGSRAAGAPRSAAFLARARGGLGAVALEAFRQKVGVGPLKRGQAWAHPMRPPHWLFALPHSIDASTDAEDAHGRGVLLAVEALLTLVHSPVAPRLQGVGMFGEPDSDHAAGGKSCTSHPSPVALSRGAGAHSLYRPSGSYTCAYHLATASTALTNSCPRPLALPFSSSCRPGAA